VSDDHIYGVIGIGFGVFNLALAAMLEENGYHDALFFDKQPELNWHGGQLLCSSELQVHYLKDLVTPVDPTSRYTFLNYLNQRGLLYQFINRKSESISRNQFQQYFRWVAQQLKCVRFGVEVGQLSYRDGLFHIAADGRSYRARHIAVATGLKHNVPECALPLLGDHVFHVGEYTRHRHKVNGRVVVIGGGQSGAEVVMDILESVPHDQLSWLGRRMSFSQLEDNCFINDIYVPSFTEKYRTLSTTQKLQMIDRLEMSSNGINQGLLDRIYRSVFERRFFSDTKRDYRFVAGQELIGITRTDHGYGVTMRSWSDGNEWHCEADFVVLATGFSASTWSMLQDILGAAPQDLRVGRNFEVQWAGQGQNDIFVQNGSRMCIGLADPNLSIAAWRAAMIANRILGVSRYALNPDTPIVEHLLTGQRT
jgi:lysine N6-hydroxylase